MVKSRKDKKIGARPPMRGLAGEWPLISEGAAIGNVAINLMIKEVRNEY